MKIGTLEISTPKAAAIVALWVGFWAWPIAVRPLVLSAGRPADAVVRRAQRDLFGLRCRITAATKLPDRMVRFYAFGNPQACKDTQTNAPVKLRLLKAGPVYWVQLDRDYGYYTTQLFLDIGFFVLFTAAAAVLIFNFTRPREKSLSVTDLRDLLNKL